MSYTCGLNRYGRSVSQLLVKKVLLNIAFLSGAWRFGLNSGINMHTESRV